MDTATVINELWTRTQARDWAGVTELIAPDAVIEWPVSGERFTGRANYVEMNRKLLFHNVTSEEHPHRPVEGEPSNRLNPVKITDPKALRALAHPARITILQHLMLDGPATATECADVAKLSPSACSYHLRALARYGFVEEERAGGADGRHRPWRATAVGLSIGGDAPPPPAVRVAGRMLLEAVQTHLEERRAEYLDREAEYQDDWQLAAGSTQDVVHVTPAELKELRSKIGELIDGYRRLRPEDRPPQTRRVGALLEFTPWFAPDAQDQDDA